MTDDIRVVHRNGYRLVWDEERQRYSYEHRVVMERALGRRLLSSEIVHHINGDKHDNDPANLQLTSRSEHPSLHPEWGKHPRPSMRKPMVPCPVCGEMFKPLVRTLGRPTRTCSLSCAGRLRCQEKASGS